jgi:hypothetical protein
MRPVQLLQAPSSLCYTPPNMKLKKKRRLLGALPFCIGMLTNLVALESVSDPNTRHLVCWLGVAVALVGLVMIYRTRSAAQG